jgi:hypothetical protein
MSTTTIQRPDASTTTLLERELMETHFSRQETLQTPRLKVTSKGGVPQVAPDHPDPTVAYTVLMRAIDSLNKAFSTRLGMAKGPAP